MSRSIDIAQHNKHLICTKRLLQIQVVLSVFYIDNILLTALTMAFSPIPNISSSSAGFPLLGRPVTASRLTMTSRHSLTAPATASPMPPVKQW